MPDFKFNVGDDVKHRDYGRATVAYRYVALLGNHRYVLLLPESGGFAAHEDELEPIPIQPLDSNGIEIGVGDLVAHFVNKREAVVIGRVDSIEEGSAMIANLFDGGAPTPRDKSCSNIESLTLLEKAPPNPISLGSRVRVKETGEEFRVLSGWCGDNDDLHWREERAKHSTTRVYHDCELELIG